MLDTNFKNIFSFMISIRKKKNTHVASSYCFVKVGRHFILHRGGGVAFLISFLCNFLYSFLSIASILFPYITSSYSSSIVLSKYLSSEKHSEALLSYYSTSLFTEDLNIFEYLPTHPLVHLSIHLTGSLSFLICQWSFGI